VLHYAVAVLRGAVVVRCTHRELVDLVDVLPGLLLGSPGTAEGGLRAVPENLDEQLAADCGPLDARREALDRSKAAGRHQAAAGRKAADGRHAGVPIHYEQGTDIHYSMRSQNTGPMHPQVHLEVHLEPRLEPRLELHL